MTESPARPHFSRTHPSTAHKQTKCLCFPRIINLEQWLFRLQHPNMNGNIYQEVGPTAAELAAVQESWNIGDEVWVLRRASGASYDYYTGIVAYTGPVEFSDDLNWVGLRLTGSSAGQGKNDGAVKGVRYFAAPANSGLFVKAIALRPRWSTTANNRRTAVPTRMAPTTAMTMMRTPPPSMPQTTATPATPAGSEEDSLLDELLIDSSASSQSLEHPRTPAVHHMERTPPPKNAPTPASPRPPATPPLKATLPDVDQALSLSPFPDFLGTPAEATQNPPLQTTLKDTATAKKSPSRPAKTPQIAASRTIPPKIPGTKQSPRQQPPTAPKTPVRHPKPKPTPPSATATNSLQRATVTTSSSPQSSLSRQTPVTPSPPVVAQQQQQQQEETDQVVVAEQQPLLEPGTDSRPTTMERRSQPPPRPPVHHHSNDDDDNPYHWGLSQQRWIRSSLRTAMLGLCVVAVFVLVWSLEEDGNPNDASSTLLLVDRRDLSNITSDDDDDDDTIHVRPVAVPPVHTWLPATLLLWQSCTAGILTVPLGSLRQDSKSTVTPLAVYTCRLAALVTGMTSLVLLAYTTVVTFAVQTEAAHLRAWDAIPGLERWLVWLLVTVLFILIPSCVALMLSFYPGSTTTAGNEPPRSSPLNQGLQSEIVPLLNDPEDGVFGDEEAEQYQLMRDESNNADTVQQGTSRLRGSRRLLQLASSQVVYLYLGCAVLLLRLPFSLIIPHFVATTLHALTHGDFGMARRAILTLFLCGSVDAFLDFWCIFLFGYANLRIVKRVRLDLFRRLLRMEVAFFDAHHSGTLTSRLNSDCSAMASDLTWFFRFSIESVVRITGIATYMLIRSPSLAACALAIVPAVAVVNKIYGDWLARNATAVQDALASTQTVAQEALSHIRTVISLGAESQMYQSYRDRVLKHYDLNVKQTFWQGIYYMVVSTFLINTVVQAALLWYGSYLIYQDRLTSDVLLAFMLYQGQLQSETMNLFQSYSSLIKSSGAGDQVFALLDRRTPPPGLGNAHENGEAEEDAPSLDATLSIRFDKVSFRYPSRPDQIVLNKMDWTVRAGQTVALVAPSGGGKSTVLALAQRLYDPTEGRIFVNDKDLRLLNLIQYRKKIGVVTQDCVLFDGTIFDNVRFGCDETEEEDEQAVEARVINAVALANLADFVGALPAGLETPIGEGGTQLSGGQKQRLAIARAIYRQPALLLLDEATSSLDASSERLVQEALDQLLMQRKGMTTIIVAHRLQTIENADTICVLKDGRIAQHGTHQELMRQKGLYRLMVGTAVNKG